MRTIAICLVVMIAGLHCLAPTLDAELTAYAKREMLKLDEARRRWHEFGPSTYSLQFDRDCFCGYGISPALIAVADDRIASVYIEEPNDLYMHTVGYGQLELVDCWSQYDFTVDDLFDLIEDGLRRDYRVDFVFDAEFGYPRTIMVATGGGPDSGADYSVELIPAPPWAASLSR